MFLTISRMISRAVAGVVVAGRSMSLSQFYQRRRRGLVPRLGGVRNWSRRRTLRGSAGACDAEPQKNRDGTVKHCAQANRLSQHVLLSCDGSVVTYMGVSR